MQPDVMWLCLVAVFLMVCFGRPLLYPIQLLPAQELPRNTYEGYLCFMGQDSHFSGMSNMAATG